MPTGNEWHSKTGFNRFNASYSSEKTSMLIIVPAAQYKPLVMY